MDQAEERGDLSEIGILCVEQKRIKAELKAMGVPKVNIIIIIIIIFIIIIIRSTAPIHVQPNHIMDMDMLMSNLSPTVGSIIQSLPALIRLT